MEAINSIDTQPSTVAQWAVSQPGALAVFAKHNIDFCCGGDLTLEEACIGMGLHPESIKSEILKNPRDMPSASLRPMEWSSSFLIDYIIQNHHVFVKNSIPKILDMLDKACRAHGKDDIDLLSVREFFIELAEELISHMEKEEVILFPAIKRMENLEDDDLKKHARVLAPISLMEHEHDVAGGILKSIRSLSNQYTPPKHACATYKLAYQNLHDFDNDLMQHIHLENNILFERYKHSHTPS